MAKTYFAPAFSNGVVSLERLLAPEAWANVPTMRGFKVKNTPTYFMHGDAWAKVAHDGTYLYMLADYDHFDSATFEYLPCYERWTADNGAEFFIKSGETLHQFETNSKGAKIYLRDLQVADATGGPCETAGLSEPGHWRIVARVPLSLFGDAENLAINVRINMDYMYNGYFEPSDIPGCIPVDELKLTDAMSAEECAEAEQTYNRSFMDYLASHDTFTECELYVVAQARSSCDMKGILEAYRAYQKADALARVGLFTALKRELTQFEGRIFSAERSSDKAMKVVDGPMEVDFAVPHGILKDGLFGMNGGPKITDIGGAFDQAFAKLRVSCSRTHDVPLTNPAMRLIDTHLIFGNWTADPGDPANYYFEQTDDYLSHLKAQGTEIIYRLGPSIEHAKKKYFVKSPADYGKFAEICAGIVRHYNRGWGGGPVLNIRYWEIWNEPNIGESMWDKNMEDYGIMYAVVARRLKSEFPEIKVGGPAVGALTPALMLPFLHQCIELDAPLDFLSWHRYGKTPWKYAEDPYVARRCLDTFGFTATETHLNEWHYAPGDWSGLSPERMRWMNESPEGMMGRDAGAFNVNLLIRWQDAPLDISNFYMACSGLFGFRYAYGGLNKNYYGFLAFAQMRDCTQLVETATNAPDSTVLIAGHDGKGHACVVISAFKHKGTELCVTIRHGGKLPGLQAFIVDQERNMEKVEGVIAAATSAGVALRIPKQSGSAVVCLLFQVD